MYIGHLLVPIHWLSSYWSKFVKLFELLYIIDGVYENLNIKSRVKKERTGLYIFETFVPVGPNGSLSILFTT